MLAAEQCLLSSSRNPQISRIEMERCLAVYLAADHVLWLHGDLVGDDTDGHVDQVARFVGPSTVVAAVEKDPGDVNYASLKANHQRLLTMSDQDGRRLDVTALPMPRPVVYARQRLPASYANFYVVNGAVIVPQFADPADEEAIAVLAPLFPGRQVIGLPAVDLVWGLGAYHCVTQQEPSPGSAPSPSGRGLG